jgi:S-adenosylmethionine decarboxylase proenzyme
MRGLHLTADLHRCTGAALRAEALALRELMLAAVRRAGLTPVGELFHPFPGGGVTGVVLLAESHVALHTWPELGAVTLDVYVCNVGADNSERARALLAALEESFEPGECDRQRVQRGRWRAPA